MMGRKRRQILIALLVIMLMAIAAYVKLWSIDHQLSAKEARLLRLVTSSFHFFNSCPFYFFCLFSYSTILDFSWALEIM